MNYNMREVDGNWPLIESYVLAVNRASSACVVALVEDCSVCSDLFIDRHNNAHFFVDVK